MKKGTLVMLSVAAVAGMTSLANATPIGVNDFTSGGGANISQTARNGGGTTVAQNAQNIGPTVSQGAPYIGNKLSKCSATKCPSAGNTVNVWRDIFCIGTLVRIPSTYS